MLTLLRGILSFCFLRLTKNENNFLFSKKNFLLSLLLLFLHMDIARVINSKGRGFQGN